MNRNTRMIDDMFIEEEIRRVNPKLVGGKQSIDVQSDMKTWALKEGHWPHMDYIHMVAAHAAVRGWTQEGFTGMEIIR